MRVDLKPWIPEDKNVQVESSHFIGTIIQQLAIGNYKVQMLFPTLAVPSRSYATNEEALKAQDEIWAAMQSIDKSIVDIARDFA